MKNRLAVVADEVDSFPRDAEILAGSEGGFGVNMAEAGVELAEFAGSEWIFFGYAKDFFSDCWREGLIGVAEEFDF
jgi:hypothetical protein